MIYLVLALDGRGLERVIVSKTEIGLEMLRKYPDKIILYQLIRWEYYHSLIWKRAI